MITYCTNVHPGEDWNTVFANLNSYSLKVKAAVSPQTSFPLGLRLSYHAAMEINNKNLLGKFKEWCATEECFVPTINGFSFGNFHSCPVKENVYFPDWRDAKRVDYTKCLVSLLIEWLPPNITGSISTVPIKFGKAISTDDLRTVRKNIIDVLEFIKHLSQRTGKVIVLSVEPEPGCLIETTEELIEFFEKIKLPTNLLCYIGICYDCSHLAVEFEDPAKSLSLILNAGIRIGKVQLSSAPSFPFNKGTLNNFLDPIYLHQVIIQKPDGKLAKYNDIPDALANYEGKDDAECRTHFHLPIFLNETKEFGTTQFYISKFLNLIEPNILLEIETYTQDLLPTHMQRESTLESIIKEMDWVNSKSYEKDSCSKCRGS